MGRYYHITLSDSQRRAPATRRQVWRDSDAEGIDSAYRALRLHRNVHRDATPAYDRWSVGVFDERKCFKILATGGVPDVQRYPGPGRGVRPETGAGDPGDTGGDGAPPSRDDDVHPDRA